MLLSKASSVKHEEQLTFLIRRTWKHKSCASGMVATIAKMVQVACKVKDGVTNNLEMFSKNITVFFYVVNYLNFSAVNTYENKEKEKDTTTYHNNYKSYC
jgi:uncharacterized membrane protein YbjE (DUF340 family)